VYTINDNASNMKKAGEIIISHQQDVTDDDDEAEVSANTDDFVIDDLCKKN